MNYPTVILIVLAALCNVATGFRAFTKTAGILTARHAFEQEVTRKVSTLEELVQAFIEAIPSVLKPPKEMDKTKVIEDPPKYLKVYGRITKSIEHTFSTTFNMTFPPNRRPLQAAFVKFIKERTNGTNKRRSTTFFPNFSQLRRTGLYSNSPWLVVGGRTEKNQHLPRCN